MVEAKCQECGAIYMVNENIPSHLKCVCRCTKFKKIK